MRAAIKQADLTWQCQATEQPWDRQVRYTIRAVEYPLIVADVFIYDDERAACGSEQEVVELCKQKTLEGVRECWRKICLVDGREIVSVITPRLEADQPLLLEDKR